MRDCKHEGCVNLCRVREGSRGVIYNNSCEPCQHSLRKYNITTPEKLNMLKEQDECCSICKSEIEFKKVVGNNTHTAVVDHCHETGVVRGILCSRCNLMLGSVNDDKEVLINAARYLKDTIGRTPCQNKKQS
jgi:hypothetical protein